MAAAFDAGMSSTELRFSCNKLSSGLAPQAGRGTYLQVTLRLLWLHGGGVSKAMLEEKRQIFLFFRDGRCAICLSVNINAGRE